MLHSERSVVPAESFCWLSYFPCLLGDALPAYLLLIPQNLFSKSCSPFCGRCHFSSFFCFYRFCYGKKKKKSLSVRIDRSLAFISGACYEHSTGDMEIGHALKNGVFEVCLEEGCERVEHVCWKWKILKTIFFLLKWEITVECLWNWDFSKGRHSQLLTFFDKNNTRESYDLKATFYQKITEVAGQKYRVTKAS